MDTEEQIRAVYRGLLGRDPDEKGRAAWSERLRGVPLSEMIASVARSLEFRRRFMQLVARSDGLDSIAALGSLQALLLLPGILHPLRCHMVQTLLPPAERVLDLGGASGSDRGALLDMGYAHGREITIIDLPPDSRFKSAQESGRRYRDGKRTVRYEYHSMADLSRYSGDSVDFVWAGQTIEHIGETEGRALFPQVARVLKPGGFFGVDTPNGRVTRLLVGEGKFIHAEHQIEYDWRDFRMLHEGAGLQMVAHKGLIDMALTLRFGHGVPQDLLAGAINDSPDTSIVFFALYRKL